MSKKPDIGVILENRMKYAADAQSDTFDDFARYRALFKSKIVDTADYPWDFTLFDPMTFTTVRNFLTRVVSPNIGVTLQAWNEESRPKTEVNQKIIDWELSEVDFFLKSARHVYQAALYGRGLFLTGWKYEKAKVIEEVDENDNVTRKVVMSPMINRADISNMRIFDLFIANRNNPVLQEQPWIIIRHYRTPGEMKAINEARGEDVYDVKKIKDKDLFVRYIDYGRDVMYNNNYGDAPFDSGLLETWEMIDKDTGQVTELVARHKELVIRKEDNPYYHGEYPIIDTPFFPEDDEYFNTGIVRPMEDLQMALNTSLNQYMSNASQQINNMWMTTDLRIPDWEFISRPNGVIHVRGDINNLREVEHKDITQTSMAMQGQIRQNIQRTSGINDYMALGLPQKGTRGTAALKMEQENMDENLNFFMTILEQHTLRQVVNQFLKLNAQFLTDEQTIKIAGRHGYSHLKINPEDVSAEFEPIIIPNSALPKNPVIKLQNLENLKAIADKEQKIKLNTAPLWKEMFELMGITDLDEIVPDDKDEALEENKLIMDNIPVECEANDNHKAHVPIHAHLLLTEKLSQSQAKAVEDHINAHLMWELTDEPTLLEKLGIKFPADQLALQIAQQNQAGGQNPNQLNQQLNPNAQNQTVPQPNAAVNTEGLVRQEGQRNRRMANPVPQVGPIRRPNG